MIKALFKFADLKKISNYLLYYIMITIYLKYGK